MPENYARPYNVLIYGTIKAILTPVMGTMAGTLEESIPSAIGAGVKDAMNPVEFTRWVLPNFNWKKNMDKAMTELRDAVAMLVKVARNFKTPLDTSTVEKAMDAVEAAGAPKGPVTAPAPPKSPDKPAG